MAFERVKQFKDVTITYDAPSGFTLKVYTDLPGGSMPAIASPRRSLSFPSSTGRKTYTATFDNSGSWLEGNIIRYRAESSGTVRLFGGSVLAREIGLYFDGGNGEVWDSGELTIGL